MHLLVINEFFYPDVCASSAVLTDHLPRIAALRPQWRITVLTSDRAWDNPNLRWPERDLLGRIQIVRVPRPASGRTLLRRIAGFAGFHWGVMSIGRRLERPDVIMSSTAPPLGGLLGMRLARRFGCAHVYRILDLYPDCAEHLGVLRGGGFIANQWRKLDSRIINSASEVVAISGGIRDRVIRDRGARRDHVTVIHDGFAPERVRPIAAEANTFRRDRGLTGKFVVQYAGNMGLSHPFDTILAAARLLSDIPHLVFQFIGAGPGRVAIESAQREMPERVQLLDYQPAERLGEVLATADVALISQAQGMSELSLPYKFYGILAAARPCIFVGPAASEIVHHHHRHECGLHIEQGDSAGLAGAMRELIADTARRERMGRAARQLFEDQFSSQRAAEAWVNLLEPLSGQRLTPPARPRTRQSTAR